MRKSVFRAKCLILQFLIVVVSSCSIEVAKPESKQIIRIASDFLTKKDSVLFQDFTKRYDIEIKILHLSNDSILRKLLADGMNHRIDAVFMRSTTTVQDFTDKRLLRNLNHRFPDLESSLTSSRMDWTALAINPYVICSEKTPEKINYNELAYRKKWYTNLPDEELILPFYGSILVHFGDNKRNEAVGYITSLLGNYEIPSKSDTLKDQKLMITTLYQCREENFKYVIPNQYDRGCFYDVLVFGIVDQARNHENAVLLLEHFLKEKENQKLAAYFEIFPIYDPKERALFEYQNDYPRLHKANPKLLGKYIRQSEKIVQKIKKTREEEVRLE